MTSADPHISPRPGLIAWLIGGFTVTIFLSFAWYADFRGQSLRRSLAIEGFRTKFAAGNFDGAHQMITLAAQTARRLDARTMKLTDEALIGKLFNLSKLAAADKFSEAETFYESEVKTGFSLLPLSVQERLKESESARKLDRQFSNYKNSAAKAQAAAGTAAAEQLQFDKASADFESLRGDLRSFLGLPTPQEKSADASVYRSGILAELPKLDGLKDSIASPEELKAELARLNGSINQDARNSQAAFRKALNELKTAAQSLKKTLEAEGSRAEDLSSGKNAAAEEHRAQKNYLLAAIQASILESLDLDKP